MTASFATTRWTLVAAAWRDPAKGSVAGAPDARALAELCATYRPPVLAHARRRGLAPADAEDAVQGFFQNLLRAGAFTPPPPGVRFRAWLLGAFNHHLADLRDHARAEKRGGGRIERLDTVRQHTLADGEPSPDTAFDRAWALALLATALERLRAEHAAAGRAEWFDALAPGLAGRASDRPQAEVAAGLGLSEPALRVALHRLRKRYREVLREEVAQTVAHADDIEDELRHLLAVVSR